MAFHIIRNDIIKVKADAIVNTANPHPTYGTGTDAAIYKAAGEELMLKARKEKGDIAEGDIYTTPGYSLPEWHPELLNKKGSNGNVRRVQNKSRICKHHRTGRTALFPI